MLRHGGNIMGSFSIWHWLIVLAIVVVLFGTKKLGDLGSDLGRAVKGFKDGVKSGDEVDSREVPASPIPVQSSAIEVEARERAAEARAADRSQSH